MKRYLGVLFLSCLLGISGAAESLTIYTEISPPEQYLGPDGALTGYTVELVREIQKRVGNTDPIEVVPWIRGYKEALSKPDIVLFSMARTAERMQLFEWLGPVRETSYRFYVKADSRVVLKNMDDARRLNLIGVYKEDVRDQYLSRLGFTNLDRSIDEATMFKKLMDGRIDALVCNQEGLARTAHSAGFKPEDLRVAMPLFKVQIYIAFSKGTSQALLKRWSTALEAIKRAGILEQLFRKYYLNHPHPGPPVVPS